MRHEQGRFHLAERALGDIAGSLPQNFLTIFPKQAESHEAPRIDAGGAGFLGLAIYKCNVGADLWGIRPAKGGLAKGHAIYRHQSGDSGHSPFMRFVVRLSLDIVPVSRGPVGSRFQAPPGPNLFHHGNRIPSILLDTKTSQS